MSKTEKPAELEGAKIVSFSSFLDDEIGKPDPKEQIKEEIKDAVSGNKNDDIFGFGSTEEEIGKPILREEENEPENNEEENLTEKSEEKTEKVETIVEEANKDVSGKNQVDTSKIYYDALKSMFGDTISHIIQQDDEGNDVEVALEEVVLDKELFEAIVESKMASLKEDLSKDKISVAGVSDLTKDLIEIDKNGGNITDLLKVKRDFSDPLDQLDITTPEGQRLAIYLRKKSKGAPDEEIEALIRTWEADGVLEEKAVAAESELRAAIQHQVELTKKQAEDQAKHRKEVMKNYKKDIKENLNSFQLNDAVKNKIVLLATKTDEEGRFEIDKAYDQARSNPESAARLALFLLDENEYIKQVTNSAVQKTKLDTASKIRVVARKSDVAPTLLDKNDRGDGITRFEDIQ